MVVHCYTVLKELLKNMEQWISADKIKDSVLVKPWKHLLKKKSRPDGNIICKKYNDGSRLHLLGK